MDEEALIRAARHLYAVLEEASARPGEQADAVDALLHKSCDCRRMVEFLRSLAARGRHIERRVEVVDATATVDSSDRGTVFVTLRQDDGRVLDRDGQVVEVIEEATDRVVIDFTLVGARLVVTQIASRRS